MRILRLEWILLRRGIIVRSSVERVGSVGVWCGEGIGIFHDCYRSSVLMAYV